MQTIEVRVRRVSVVSSRPFDEVVQRLTESIGRPDMIAFHRALAGATVQWAISVMFGKGFTTAAPGSVQGTLLVVNDIQAARADLIAHDVDVKEVFHFDGGLLRADGTQGRLGTAQHLRGGAPLVGADVEPESGACRLDLNADARHIERTLSIAARLGGALGQLTMQPFPGQPWLRPEKDSGANQGRMGALSYPLVDVIGQGTRRLMPDEALGPWGFGARAVRRRNGADESESGKYGAQ